MESNELQVAYEQLDAKFEDLKFKFSLAEDKTKTTEKDFVKLKDKVEEAKVLVKNSTSMKEFKPLFNEIFEINHNESIDPPLLDEYLKEYMSEEQIKEMYEKMNNE